MYQKVWLKLNIMQNEYTEREAIFGFRISFFSNLLGKLKYSCLMEILLDLWLKTLWLIYFKMDIRGVAHIKELFNTRQGSDETVCVKRHPEWWGAMQRGATECSSLYRQRPRCLIPDGKKSLERLRGELTGTFLIGQKSFENYEEQWHHITVWFSVCVCLYTAWSEGRQNGL